MSNFKKLIFAPLFIVAFAILCYQLNPLLTSTDLILSLDLTPLLALAGLLILSSFLFILFTALAQDWKLAGGVIMASGIIPVIFLPGNLSLYMAVGTILSLVLIFALLLNKLKSYINFQPTALLTPLIKNLATLLSLAIAVVYFLSIGQVIEQKGVRVFDPLVESTTSLINRLGSTGNNPGNSGQTADQQLNNLRNNPALLKKYGIDPGTLDNPVFRDEVLNGFNNQAAGNSTIIRSDSARGLLGPMLEPYLNFLAPILAVLVFFSFTSFIWLFGLFIPPLLWITFLVMKNTGFIKFQTEMREVKKLVV